MATDDADQPNTAIPIREQIERQRALVGRDKEALRRYNEIVGKLDVPKNQGLIHRHGSMTGFDGPLKYLDCAYWLRQKLELALALGLDRSPPSRILDIGTGGGHFLLVCQALGHEVVGIDIDVPLYDEIADLLGVRRVVHRVERGKPLPDLGGPFDLVFGFATLFDHLPGGAVWSKQDWSDFMRQLMRTHVRAPGRIYFNLNRLADPVTGEQRFREHVGEVFRDYGGQVDPRRSIVDLAVTTAMVASAMQGD